MVGNLVSPNLPDDKLKALYDDYVQVVFDEDNVSRIVYGILRYVRDVQLS